MLFWKSDKIKYIIKSQNEEPKRDYKKEKKAEKEQK